jgi:hypothetical protein
MPVVLAAPFPKEFYLAAAGAIPVLWLTAGFATSAIATVIQTLRAADVSTHLGFSAPGVVGRALPTVTLAFGVGRLRVQRQQLTLELGVHSGNAALATLFVLGLVLAGIVGEIASLVALLRQQDDPVTVVLVLGSVSVLTLLSGLVLLVSLVAGSRAATGAPAPSAAGSPPS